MHASASSSWRPLSTWPAPARLAAGGFALLVLGFALLAQVNLWEQDGGGQLPGADAVLAKYHGSAEGSRLHAVLDPALPQDDLRAMWPFLGDDETTRAEARGVILDWVEAGAPASGFAPVAAILQDPVRCAQCHTAGMSQESMAFDSHAEVLPYAQVGGGMPLAPLLISAHNHLFGFAVLALLLSLLTCATTLGVRWKVLLILGACVGPALDIGGWFLTRALGSPFQFLVMAGGAIFGICTTLMALAVLHEAVRGRADKGSDPSADAV